MTASLFPAAPPYYVSTETKHKSIAATIGVVSTFTFVWLEVERIHFIWENTFI